MQTLLEADFLTVNLGNIINRKASTPAEATTAKKSVDLSNITDWGNELQARLTANRRLSSEARESDSSIEAKFFEDYFNNANEEWDAHCAKQLLCMGEPLRKALKVLSFDRDVNPILGFILNDFVITELIKPGLLNANTFKAIYNAVAKKLIDDNEFFAYNDHNIIYCKNLYRKSANEILSYLELQSNILPEKTKNIHVFINNAQLKEKDFAKRAKEIEAKLTELPTASIKDGELNSLELADTIRKELATIEAVTADGAKTIANSLKTPAAMLATLQYLSYSLQNAAATKLMANEVFQSVKVSELVKATPAVAKVMAQKKITPEAAATMIATIQDNIIKQNS